MRFLLLNITLCAIVSKKNLTIEVMLMWNPGTHHGKFDVNINIMHQKRINENLTLM